MSEMVVREAVELAVPQVPPEAQLEHMVQTYELYQEACRRLLNDSDYAVIRGQRFRKRSGWAKLRRAFNVSVEILEERYVEYGDVWGFAFTVKASLPNGRFEVAEGMCTSDEFEGQDILPTRHNVRAKALTRAKNRATSDVLGAGLVSAEEVETGAKPKRKRAKKAPGHWIEDAKIRNRFWRYCKEELALSRSEVHEALGVESVKEFDGTMQQAKALLDEYVKWKMEQDKEQADDEEKQEVKE